MISVINQEIFTDSSQTYKRTFEVRKQKNSRFSGILGAKGQIFMKKKIKKREVLSVLKQLFYSILLSVSTFKKESEKVIVYGLMVVTKLDTLWKFSSNYLASGP